MLGKFVFLIQLVTICHYANTSCSQGTLTCEKSDSSTKPLVCDFFNSYVLNSEGTMCQINEVTNCEVSGLSMKDPCLKCMAAHIFDSETQKCVKIEEENLVENCAEYHLSKNVCKLCKSDFYLSDGECLAISENKVANCAVYSSATECQTCVNGYRLVEKACLMINALPNCHYHTNVECLECQDGLAVDLSQDPEFKVSDLELLELYNQRGFKGFWRDEMKSQVCQSTKLEGCSKFEDFENCKTCKDGFYLSGAKKCVRVQEDPVANCLEYIGAGECKFCKNKFYLDSTEQVCKISTTVENCDVYQAEFDGCKTCKSTHIMDGANTCPTKRTNSLNISNCSTKNPNRDECQVCSDGFLLSNDFLKCYPLIKNCKTNIASNGSTSHNTCAQCDEGYHPDNEKKSCIKSVINNCEKIRSQMLECEQCKTGYYWDSVKKNCERQSIANCEEYQANSPNCEKCRSLFYLQGNECKPLNKKDHCYESDGKTDMCRKCDRLYFFNSAKTECPGVNTRSVDAIDSLCLSNTENKNSSRCTECQTNNFMLEGNKLRTLSAQEMTSKNCAKLNPETGECSQCVENSNGDDATKSCSQPNNGLTTICAQNMEGFFGPLNQNNCAKCRNPKTHFLHVIKGDCKERTLPSIDASCLETNPNSDADCSTCVVGTFPSEKPEYEDQCVSNGLIGSYPISGCKVYDVEDGKCFYCQEGKLLSEDKLTCNDETDLTKIFYDVKMVNRGPKKAENLISNCSRYIQVDTSRIKCIECATNFVKVVSNTQNSYDFSYLIGDVSLGLGGQFPFVESCVSKAESFKLADGTTINTSGNCDIAISVAGKQGYGCIRCKKGLNSNVVFAEKDAFGVALPEKKAVVGPCISDSTMTTSYDGLGYHNRTNIDHLPYSSYLRYSNCNSNSNFMIFNSILKEDGSIELTDIKHSSGQSKLAFCVPSNNSFKLTSTTFRDNCAIFAYKSKPEPTFAANSPPVDACMACKPGYKPIVEEGSRIISDCQEITQCNKTSDNLWLNACKNPLYAYKIDTVENNELIMFHEPIPSKGSVDKCAVYSNDLSQCLLCTPGFSVINNLCKQISSDVTYNCATIGSDRNKLSLENSSNENLRLMNYMSYLNSKNNVTTKQGTLCSVCKTNFSLGINMNDVYQKCVDISGVAEEKKIEGCLNYELSSPPRCSICDSTTYVLNKTTGKCVDKAAYPDCLEITGETFGTCSKCPEGFALDSSNICKETFCESMNGENCAFCKRNYIYNKADPDDKLFCKQNTDSPGFCDNFSPLTQSCGRCSTGKVLFLFYEINGEDKEALQGFTCESGDLNRTTLPGWKGYNLETAYIKVVLNKLQTDATISLEYVDYDGYSGRKYTLEDPTKSPAESHCFPKRLLRDCHPDSIIGNGALCLKCQNGKFLDKTSNECKGGSIVGCDVYTNNSTCEKCMSGHYLLSNKCTKYSTDLNCKEFKPNQDACSSCNEGSFLNTSQKCEVYNKSYNCETFNSNENSCLTCKPKHYVDLNNRQCKPYTGFCEEGETDRDECTKCPNIRYLNQDNKTCVLYTINSDCVTFDPNRDVCLKCVTGKYPIKDKNECRVNPDGITGCKVYSELNKCAECGTEMYLKDNKCLKAETLVSDCDLYESDGVCMKCMNTHVLDEQKACVSVTVNNCLEPLTTTVCKKCMPGFVMKVTGEVRDCEDSNIPDCEQAVGGTNNICLKCKSPKVPSADRQSCVDTEEIANCEEYYQTNTCMRCAQGYIRSPDWKMCQKAEGRVQASCKSAAITQNVVCDMCKDNFTKNEKGECVFCSAPGCAVCGETEKDPCQMCRKGYYMDSTLKCIEIEIRVGHIESILVGLVTVLSLLLF